MTPLDPSLDALDSLSGVEALCFFITQDERPLTGAAGYADWRLCGGLSRVLQDGFFSGTAGEQLLMPTLARLPALKLFAVGAGGSAALDAEALGAVLEGGARMLQKAGVASVAVALPQAPRLDDQARAEALKKRFVPAFGGKVVQVFAERGLKGLL